MNEESIFTAAIQCTDQHQRAAFLNEACGDDAELRQRVESLLRSHEEGGSFLDEPAAPVPPTLAAESIAEGPGTSLGPYKLLQQIGEGGFGVVYMAEQLEPLRRKVALKIIKPGMDTRAVVARFEAERQTLAIMEHPNIARVLDAGATESGRPYFVMELVKGVPITEYCDKNSLPTRERLDLFATICRAVHHAHQKGIIHRDIKPSNVMVTLHDGQPVPKIIDFGVSKAISQQLTEKTLFTAYGQMIGTPQYMSPEQAEMSGLDIDTRSDVYSLGVLLYELLTGTTPLDGQQLRNAGYAEMQKLIQDQEAPKPSNRLSTLGGELTVVAKHHNVDPRRLAQLLRGDLDWIVMKALSKERSRRYDSANGFATDIERFLKSEAIEARPPSAFYRLQKTARRHKGAFTTVAALLLVLIAGIVGTTTGMFRARVANRDAQAEAERARTAEQETQNALDDSERLRTQLTDSFQQVKASNLNLAVGRANSLIEQDKRQEGLLWLTRALEMAPADNEPLQHEIRTGISLLVDEFSQPHWAVTPTDGTSYVDFAVSRDGRYVVAIERGEPSRALLWDTATRRQLRALPLPLDAVWAELSAGGQTLLVADEKELLRFDLETGQQIGMPLPLPVSSTVHPVRAVSPRGDVVMIYGRDGQAVLAELDSGQTREITGIRGRLMPLCVSFSNDGGAVFFVQALASPQETRLRQLDVRTGKLREDWQVSMPGSFMTQFAISPDSQKIAVCVTDYESTYTASRFASTVPSRTSISLLDYATGESLHRLSLKARPKSVSFSVDGSRFMTLTHLIGEGSQIDVWDTVTGRHLHRTPAIDGRLASPTESVLVGWGLDKQSFVYASSRSVSLWEVPRARTLNTLLPHAGYVTSMGYSADGKQISILISPSLREHFSGTTFMARSWDVESATSVRQLPVRGRVAALSPDGTQMVSASGVEVQRWSLATGEKVGPAIVHPHNVVALQFTGDGKAFLTQTRKPVRSIREQPRIAYHGIGAGMQDTPEGPSIKALFDGAAEHAGLLVGDVLVRAGERELNSDADLIEELDRGQGVPLELTFIRSGKEIRLTLSPKPKSVPILSRQIERSTNGQIRIYGTATGEPVGELPIPLAARPSVVGSSTTSFPMAASHDGRSVLTVQNNTEMRLWNAHTGRPLGPWTQALMRIHAIRFSPDGHTLAIRYGFAGINGGEVQLWSIENLQPLGPVIRPSGVITAMEFSPDSKLLATAAGLPKEAQTLQLWSTSTARPVGPAMPLAIKRGVSRLAFSPAGDQLAVAAWQGPCLHFLDLAQRVTGPVETISLASSALTRSELDEAGSVGRIATQAWSARIDAWREHRDDRPLLEWDPLSPAEMSFLEVLLLGADDAVENEASERLVAREPGSWRAHIWRLQSHARSAAWEQAEEDLQAALRLASRQQVADWLQAEVESLAMKTGLATRLRSGDLAEEAQEALLWYTKQCVALTPDNWPMQLVRAQSLSRADRFQEAKEAFRAALGVGPRAIILESYHAGTASGIDLLGDSKTDTDVAKRSIAQLNWRLEVAPDDWRTRIDRAVFLTYLDRWDEASRDVNQTIESSSGDEVAARLKDLVDRSLAAGRAILIASDNSRRSRILPNPAIATLLYRQTLWALNHIVELTPDDRSAVYSRAGIHGCLRNWREAADDMARAVDLEPEQHFAWYRLGPLLLELNETERYQQHCEEMLNRFDESVGPMIHGRANEQMLWSKDAPHDWNRLADYFEDQVRNKDVSSGYLRWRECAAGIACYRNGKLDAAVKWLEQSLANDPLVYCEARARLTLAMTYHAQGYHDKARETLQKARAMFSERIPSLNEGPLDGAWAHWLIAKILLREADELIVGDPCTGLERNTSDAARE